MRALVVVSLAAACTASSPASRALPAPRPGLARVAQPSVAPLGHGDCHIVGRVVLGGNPVPYFGVTFARSYEFAPTYESPLEVRASNGVFSVRAPSGTWDMIIAGPGFARHVLPRVELSPATPVDLGDIAVSPGHTVTGVVRDEQGNPVIHARVSLETSVVTPLEGLSGFAAGNATVITDTNGQYKLAGVEELLTRQQPPMSLWATTWDHRASWPVHVEDEDATIDLEVTPSGSIDIVATGTRPTLVGVRDLVAGELRIPSALDVPGRWRLDDVPSGSYEVFGIGPGQHIASTTVAAIANTMITATLATDVLTPVDVEIRWRYGKCREISLRDLDGPGITQVACAGDSARFTTIEPGAYIACVEAARGKYCDSVDLGETPRVQQVDVPKNR